MNRDSVNFLNLSVALIIFLTFLVTVAADERSFPKLKHIKTLLQSTTSQEQLVCLATITTEMLKRENIDMSSAVEDIDKTIQAMIEMRSDKGFQQALVDSRNLCNSIETKEEFQEPEVRPLRKKEAI
ncbi:hypothetical protein AVEN_131299-1 [Araneus ventricosus]|uniref:HAT C-terminal dimerisation domain-containing protein n=1 Tax=Araneus ventricosus TaxID=182803 RepID=A0A4Y2HF48_ARAVE|nr:hypothetical protein AVEN_131299-1 [Araneus ventricosus]